jgi:preprotein translocase subunit YajC
MQELAALGLFLALLLAAYWSFVIFPRQRDFQKRQRFARALEVGDEVITYGGIIGRVIDIQGDQGIAHLEIAEGVVIRLVTAALIQPYDAEEVAKAARIGLEEEKAQAQ